jgi:hypothetical protein
MADQKHDLIARLTTDSIDMGTYDMAMPADRDPTYTPDPAETVSATATRCALTPGCGWPPHDPAAHPCGQPHVPGSPCVYCGTPTPADGGPCPDCWTPITIADAKAIFAEVGLSVDLRGATL